MAPLRHHDMIRLRGTGSRTRTCDWRGGHAGGHFLQQAEKKRIFVLLTTFCYHLDGDGSDGEDCRGGMRLSHFQANSVATSLILATAAVAVSVGSSLGRKDCVSPSDPFERFHRCPRFHNALLLTPVAWRNGLRLLTGEHQSALYVTALQTLQGVVLEAGDRHGVVLHHLRHMHFCRAH